MAWRIDFTRNADKAMRKLDKGVAARVFDELDETARLGERAVDVPALSVILPIARKLVAV